MILKERFTTSLKFALFVVVALPLIALPISGFAAGDSGDPDNTNNADSIKKKKFVFKCFRGWIRNPKGRCVREEKSSGLDQDTIYFYGRDLAREGQYDNAIRVLYLAHDQSDPRVLNYLGYSNRKLGNMEKALGYYRAAVASNPDYSLVREYLGEAYVQLGELEKAREQLTQIERICSNKTCHEYSMLSKYLVESQL